MGRDSLRYTDLSPDRHALCARVRPYTQTSRERVTTLADAVEYVIHAYVPGDFVEYDVWRGGSSTAVALTLSRLGATDRDLWLYDIRRDAAARGAHRDRAGREVKGRVTTMLGNSGLSLPEAEAAMRSTRYPELRVRYVLERVEDTIPPSSPAQIALLRLDTDWCESLDTSSSTCTRGHYAGAPRRWMSTSPPSQFCSPASTTPAGWRWNRRCLRDRYRSPTRPRTSPFTRGYSGCPPAPSQVVPGRVGIALAVWTNRAARTCLSSRLA